MQEHKEPHEQLRSELRKLDVWGTRVKVKEGRHMSMARHRVISELFDDLHPTGHT